jgi:tetratricopeptide (TPR) repeat protein
MSFSRVSRTLLAAAFASSLIAQEPAVDLATVRKAANAALQGKQYDVAAANFRKICDADPKDGQAWQLLGYALHAAGKLDEALPIHLKAAEFPRFAGVGAYNAACVHALKGDKDAAFACLEKALAAGFDDIDQLKGDEDFAALRSDPRMVEIAAALQAKAATPKVAVYEQSVLRKNARAAWFGKGGSPGQIAIDWSPVPWNDEFDEALASGKFLGKKWRLGADFWTRLDTTFDVRFGDVTVPAGYWYLTVEQRANDAYVLAMHDPAVVRKKKIDAYQAETLQGGIEVPMTHGKAAKAAPTLDVAIEMKPGSKTDGVVRVRFGGHELSAPFTVAL